MRSGYIIPDTERILCETAGNDLEAGSKKDAFNRRDLAGWPDADDLIIITKPGIHVVLGIIFHPVADTWFNHVFFKAHIISDQLPAATMIDELILAGAANHPDLDL